MRLFWIIASITCTALPCLAQVQSGGGMAAGLGKVYEASGRSSAAQGLQRKMNTALIRAVTREKSTARPGASANQRGIASTPPASTEPAQTKATIFRPDPRSNYLSELANEIGSNPEEREQLQRLFAMTKEAFEREVAAKGRSKDIAAAFTFFIASSVTVYRNDPEPSDAAIDSLWEGMSSALTDMPEVQNLTDAEKQQLYDMLVGLSGFMLAGYAEGQTNAESRKVFQQLAGVLIETVLKTDPKKLRFSKTGLDIS